MSGFLLNPYIVTSPPVNTALPVISGTAQAGQTLTTTNGTWTGNPTSYTYQWNRSGSPISGATSSSYTLVSADVSNTITVTVTATSAAGSTSATSTATATVTVPAPVNTALPTISGNQAYGNTMTTTTGSWDYSPTSYTYQWKRNGSNIGTNSSTYTTTVSDDNTTLTVTVTATNATGSNSATSSGLSIYKPIPVNSVAPTTNGNYAVGQTLSISSYGTWSNSPTDYYIQYFNNVGTYLGGGYTGTTYTIPAGQIGYQIRAAVYAINNNPSWGGPSYTAYTNTVYDATPVNTAVPTISGTAQVGSVLTATSGSWTNSPTSYAYQWYRSNGVAISGATSSTYTLVSADQGYQIRVRVIASNSIASSAAAYSSYTVTVTAGVTGGQQEYTTSGSYYWSCPAGVTSVSVVCVGAGGGGGSTGDGCGGGGGGGLGWKNNISVTPGTAYLVVVGGSSAATTGGDSYFINTSTVRGMGGTAGSSTSSGIGGAGGSWVGDGGGVGGTGGTGTSSDGTGDLVTEGGGGGGAGGYSGNGGKGQSTGSGVNALAGSGGGGGGGGSCDGGGYGGGGVGLLGQGTNGSAGVNYTSSQSNGGSGGSAGTAHGSTSIGTGSPGGAYGGGGGGGDSGAGAAGGSGAVRIIWGSGRSFPSTNTANV